MLQEEVWQLGVDLSSFVMSVSNHSGVKRMAGEKYLEGGPAPKASLVSPLHVMPPWDSVNKETAPDTVFQLWTRNTRQNKLHNSPNLWYYQQKANKDSKG